MRKLITLLIAIGALASADANTQLNIVIVFIDDLGHKA